MQHAEIAQVLGVPDPGPGEASGYSIDTRTLQPGDLFFALRGEQADGHDFVAKAALGGASAAIVERRMPVDLPQFVVDSTEQALAGLGRAARKRLRGYVFGVTGSAGKTTTKETAAHLLAGSLRVTRSEGNLNNHLGVPLSLLRMDETADAAVVEMGMNHAGEIAQLCKIAEPDAGIVTNAGYAHIENFTSREGVALAKKELIDSLGERGVAILNAEDERVARFREPAVTFGFRDSATVRATDVEYGIEGSRFVVDGVRFECPLIGRHGVLNVLAGIAAGLTRNVPLEVLAEQAKTIPPVKMRGERMETGGMVIWNDTYNSNPDAAKAMLEAIADLPATRRIAVLGEMLELGRWAETLHREIGSLAARSGYALLVGIRGAARHLVEAAIASGLPTGAAFFFEDPREAGRQIRELARPGDAILFKGSRGTRVELALEAFLAREAA
jgi:UDP-N-acetylmuramoyl-tripeptide--D-alanyl-D-alanine ligase